MLIAEEATHRQQKTELGKQEHETANPNKERSRATNN
jgi:hypothetical protein